MQIVTKDNRQVVFRRLFLNDLDNLYKYLQSLSAETKKRFGPHEFDLQSLFKFYESNLNLGYIAVASDTNDIIAYSIVKIGFLEHDRNRLESYGMLLDNQKDSTFASSVTDLWQGYGIGNHLFNYLLLDLITLKIERIILWGGVQMDNERALNYYKKIGFNTIGQFTYNGENYDMIYDISKPR
jgi:ribosomal protein S18 acetylase RimI-like enzyme